MKRKYEKFMIKKKAKNSKNDLEVNHKEKDHIGRIKLK
jgi:hypothetical protein